MNDGDASNSSEPGPDPVRPEDTAAPRRRARWLPGIAIAALALAALAWWLTARSIPQAQPARNAAPPTPVVAAAAQTGDIDITQSALGTVTSLATVTIRSQIAGRIMRIDFTEGQEVEENQLLIEIDSRPFEVALAQAQGQLTHDEALLANAKLDLQRYEKLGSTGAASKQQLDTQRYLVNQLEGTVVSDQAQIDSAKLNIAYCHIVAPVAGRVGLRQVDVGNFVTPQDTNGIVVITQLKPITVVFAVPEDSVPPIFKRLQANASLPVTAYDRSGTTRLAEGMLATLDNQIDTTTGTLRLKAEFGNDDESLFPNQFVNVRLLVDVLQGAVVVPTSAVQRGAPGTFVYRVNADSTVTAQPVELGPSSGDRVAVKSGLNVGDRVVVDGADRLRDGARVSLRQPSTVGSAGTGQPGGGGRPPQGAPK
jgi:membrane fusion protein, multidrug efflux system